MSNYHAPHSVLEGLDWPAVPSPEDVRILALAYQLEQSQWWPEPVLTARQLRQAETLCAHAGPGCRYIKTGWIWQPVWIWKHGVGCPS